MKKLILPVVFFVLLSCNDSNLQQVPYEEYLTLMMSNQMPPPADIVIKDEFGNVIDVDSFSVLQRNHGYFDQFYKNKKGEIVEYKLVKQPSFKEVEIDCSRAGIILDSLYKIDQSIRTKFDPRKDYSNLEMVYNITQKCGMPTMQSSMNAVFMIVQHNHVSHQKAYIERFRKATEEGLLSRSTLALMEDRILVSEGKPQLYGTQIRRGSSDEPWELYEIFEPGKIEKRRREMGMIPFQDYLNNYGIVFNVDQVE